MQMNNLHITAYSVNFSTIACHSVLAELFCVMQLISTD
jgi:hypothetical protein